MIQIQNIDIHTFSLNGFNYKKVFIAIPVGDGSLKIVCGYDSRLEILQVTKVSEIEVDGVVYANSTLCINALKDILFSKETTYVSSQFKIYKTLAEAQALDPKPDNGILFQVSSITDSNNAGYHSFQSAETNGTKFEYDVLQKATEITENNEDVATAGQVFDKVERLKKETPTLQSNSVFKITNKHSNEKFYQLVKHILLSGGKDAKEYYIKVLQVKFTESATKGIAIDLHRVDDDVKVANFFVDTYITTDNYAVIDLVEFNSSGITGKVVLDWSFSGTIIINDLTPDNSTINKLNVKTTDISDSINAINTSLGILTNRNNVVDVFQVINLVTEDNRKGIYNLLLDNNTFGIVNERYYVSLVNTKFYNGDGLAIEVKKYVDGTNDVVVALYYNQSFTGTANAFDVIDLPIQNNSGVTVQFLVDFSVAAIGNKQYTINEAEINPKNIKIDQTTSLQTQITDNKILGLRNDNFDYTADYSDMRIYEILIKPVQLFSDDPKEEYYVSSINFRWIVSSEHQQGLALVVKRASDNVEVCSIYNTNLGQTSAPLSGIVEVDLVEKNASGITGKAFVNWDYAVQGLVRTNMTVAHTKIKREHRTSRPDYLKPQINERPKLHISNQYTPTIEIENNVIGFVRIQEKLISFRTHEVLKDHVGNDVHRDMDINGFITTSPLVYKERTLQVIGGSENNLTAVENIFSVFSDDAFKTYQTVKSNTPWSNSTSLNTTNGDLNGYMWGMTYIEKYGIPISTGVNRKNTYDECFFLWSLTDGKTWDFMIPDQYAKTTIQITDLSTFSGNAITLGAVTLTEGVDFVKRSTILDTIKAIRHAFINHSGSNFGGYINVDEIHLFDLSNLGTAGNGTACSITGSGATVTATFSGAVNYAAANNYNAYREACTLDQFNGNTIADNVQNGYVLTNCLCDVEDGILLGSHFVGDSGRKATYSIKINYTDLFDITNATTSYVLMNNAEAPPKAYVEPTMFYDKISQNVYVGYRSQTNEAIAFQISTDKGVNWSELYKIYHITGRQDNNKFERLPISVNIGGTGWNKNFTFPNGETITDANGVAKVNAECLALFNLSRYTSEFKVATTNNHTYTDTSNVLHNTDPKDWKFSNFETLNSEKSYGLSYADKKYFYYDAGTIDIPCLTYNSLYRCTIASIKDYKLYDDNGTEKLKMVLKIARHKI